MCTTLVDSFRPDNPTERAVTDNELSKGMQVEVKIEDGWYKGVVTGIVKVADAAFSLNIYFECDQITESNVPYPHHECRRLPTGAKKRKPDAPVDPEGAAILATCMGNLIVELVLPFMY